MMQEQVIHDIETEKKEILKRYRALLKACRRTMEKGDRIRIRKAFDISLEAHKDMRRKSGEPYIYHPLAVAHICAEEIGLGTTSIICALLHDVVEDTELSIEDIERLFGSKEAKIIDGLTKISGVIVDPESSSQAENFRKMLLTMSEDVRVILIKLADRLHNMRTLESMKREKQLKIASETLFLYAPLAHRLGLNAIKTELENLSLKFTESSTYVEIEQKLKETEPERRKYIAKFIAPLKTILEEQGLNIKIFGRPKSVFSINNKIKTKGVTFEEIYDIFAIRIVVDSYGENEKTDCWKVYSLVTDVYYPSPDRLRDWISTPKANGYESLHTTVMGPDGKWVEVQIRTTRMDEIAEKGYAAHWKYKDGSNEGKLDDWLRKIRDILESPAENAMDFLDNFKLNLFAEEIYVFTPKGEMKILPINATALDFAFEIHTQVGSKCIGAKVNHKLVPLSYRLKSGDQIEILTSGKQKPKEEWLSFVVSANAKSKIKYALKEEKREIAENGKEALERKFSHLKTDFNTSNIAELVHYYKLPNSQELFYRIAVGNINLDHIKDFQQIREKLASQKSGSPGKNEQSKTLEQMVREARGSSDMLVLGENLQKIDYKLSPCCNPIPGDDVFGFITISEGIKIHRVNCPNAIQLLSNYAYRVVKAKWISQELIQFLAGIKITGIDEVGLVNNITRIISNELNVNMRSLSFDSNDGLFEGQMMVFVHDTNHLTDLMNKLKKVNGVLSVTRTDGK
jgi:guanosine-3',5'-bis(diphosphate) 3'-pyrophosphohydrolase